MAIEYNSRLISELYTGKDRMTTLEEMYEIGDPVFIYPLIDIFKKTKDDDCLWVLLNIDSPEVLQAILTLLNEDDNLDQYQKTLPYILSILNKHKFYTNELVNYYASQYIIDNITPNLRIGEWGYVGEYRLEQVLTYLKGAGQLKPHKENLQKMFFQSDWAKDVKRTVLQFLLKLDTTEQFSFLIDHYNDYAKTDKEIIIAKELTSWQGPKVSKLKELIIANGGSRAKEILEEEKLKQLKKIEANKESEAKKDEFVFNNFRVVKEIASLRESLNTITLADERFTIKFFPDNELLIKQLEVATEAGQFKSCCTDLRSIIQDINLQATKHGLSDEQVKELLPNIAGEALKLSLNKFYLYLESKSIDTGQHLFEIRKINRVCSLLAHPEKDEELLDLLKKFGWSDDYLKEDWGSLHKKILDKYKKSLTDMKESLMKTIPSVGATSNPPFVENQA